MIFSPRTSISYNLTDGINGTVGADIVIGADDHTFFGQNEDNSNVYGRLRYTF